MNFIFALFFLLPASADENVKPGYNNLSHKGAPDIKNFVKPIKLATNFEKKFIKTSGSEPATYQELVDEAVFNCPNVKNIKRQLKKSVKKNCSFKSEKRKWLAAWVTAVRSPKKGGRCYEKVKHYGLLKRWHRSIKKLRKKIKDSDHYGCGC